LIAYANSFHGPFIRDDILRIVEDPAIRSFPDCVLYTARPVTNLTLWLNYHIGEYDVTGYHALNLLLHLLSALLLYGLVRRTLLLIPPYAEDAARVSWFALAAAALWTVHPVQTESVTYIIQRSESLAALFYLACIYSFARSQTSDRSRAWLLAGLLFAILAAGAKPVAVTLPVAALLYDRAYLSRSFSRSWREHRVFLSALASTWVLLAGLLLTTRESVASAGFGARLISPWQYMLTQAGVVLHYLRLIFWPGNLCFDYGWPAADGFLAAFPQWLVLAALLAAAVFAYARFPRAGYPALFFFLALSTTSSFIPIAQYAVEHRLYLPLAGMAVLAVACADRLVERLPSLRRRHAGAIALVALLAIVLTVLTVLTHRRNQDYRSSERIWRSVLDVAPQNPVALVALAGELNQQERFRESIELCRQALPVLPPFSAMSRDQADEAIRGPRGYDAFDQLQRYVDTLNSLGYALLMLGQTGEAKPYLEEALRLMPESAVAHQNMAALYGRQGQLDQALQEWRAVRRLQPANQAARAAVAKILAARQQPPIGQNP
jgi:tetratricopeptide (TPR) repeat protein